MSNFSPVFRAGLGSNGKLLRPVGASSDVAQSMLLVDGKIIISGHTFNGVDYDIFFTRLNPDGTVDGAFGNAGVVVVPVGAATNDWGFGLYRQADGSLIVAGASASSVGGSSDTVLVRVMSDGRLDTGFSDDGKLILDRLDYNQGYSVAQQSDGKLIVGGGTDVPGGTAYNVTRLNADGSVDATFGTDDSGSVVLPVGLGISGMVYTVAVDTSDRIWVASSSLSGGTSDPGFDFSVIRLDPDGTLDPGFGTGGVAFVDIAGNGDFAFSAALDAQGRLVVIGASDDGAGKYDFSICRLGNDGSLDPSFGTGGKVTVPAGSDDDLAFSLAFDGAGRILVAGTSFNKDTSLFEYTVIRLGSSGELDSTFGVGGVVKVPFAGADAIGYALAVQADGKILLVGEGLGASDTDIGLVRLEEDGTLDAGFNAETLGGVVLYTENAAAAPLDTAVAVFDAELAAQGHYDGATLTLVRHGGANGEDVFSARGNLVFSLGNAFLSGVDIGTVVNGSGQLQITFNSAATQARVNEALSSLGYANTADAPPASVQLDWVFSDQAAIDAQAVTGSTVVAIAAVNDVPTGGVTLTGSALYGQVLTAVSTVADADGLGLLGYKWFRDGVTIAGATAATYQLSLLDIGTLITAQVSYVDGGGTTETVGSVPTARVNITTTPVAAAGLSIINGTANAETLNGTAASEAFYGQGGNDRLNGGGGDDWFDGGTGNDTMTGGSGNDVYIVNSTSDSLVESANNGLDTVVGTVTHTLASNVERLILAGTANISGTGNSLNNLLVGNSGNNSLVGGDGNDVLMGGAGIDTLSGGTGADTMEGGVGNDTYVVDNAGDVVVELSGEGTDLVQSSITYVLTGNVENLTLTGSSAINGTGNALANVITGNTGANALSGGDGNDSLSGGNGNDTLNGGAGNDTMVGGAGNDFFFVDSTGDVVSESNGGGTDTISSSVTLSLSSLTNVENLVLSGSGNINGTGNALSNRLSGNGGDNVLNGGTGADTMEGGVGNDTYVVDNAGDVVVELSGEGTDLVQSSITYVLTGNVENLTLTGSSTINGTGNALANVITGNTGANALSGGDGNDSLSGGNGNDTLNGGAGNDTMVGGAGNDMFTFDNLLSVDSITDYVAANDTIRLVRTGAFSALSAGTLSVAAFRAGSAAQDADDRIIYDNSTGVLYYDADGNGAGAQIQFAVLVGLPTGIINTEFVVV